MRVKTPPKTPDTRPLHPSASTPKIEYMSELADIIAQETQDGRLIVRFLLCAMDGDFPDFQPCHRIDAARLLVKLGFDQAQSAVDRANAARRARAAQRAPSRDSGHYTRHSGEGRNPGAEVGEAQAAANDVRAELARIVREETAEGRSVVQFLVEAMEGERPDFKPCHRLAAAKELLQRGFDYVPEDAADQAAAEPEPDLDPAEREARRRLAEDMEFARHSSTYYANIRPYPCVCEDRLHDCEGNLLDDEQRDDMAHEGPGGQWVIGYPDRIDDYVARYAKYLEERWNVEHPEVPIDINRIHWITPNWQHLNHVDTIHPVEALKRIRSP